MSAPAVPWSRDLARAAVALIVEDRPGQALYLLRRTTQRQWETGEQVRSAVAAVEPWCPCGSRRGRPLCPVCEATT